MSHLSANLANAFRIAGSDLLESVATAESLRFAVETAGLIVESGSIYFSTFFGSQTLAVEHIVRWFSRPTSVFASANVSIVCAADTLAGCLVGLSGDRLEKAQKADLAFMLQTLSSAERSALVSRIRGKAGVSAKAGPQDYYVRALTVAEQFRGQKLGKLLLDHADHLAAAAGCKLCKLDVYASNTPALRLYTSAGFEILATQFDAVAQDYIHTMIRTVAQNTP